MRTTIRSINLGYFLSEPVRNWLTVSQKFNSGLKICIREDKLRNAELAVEELLF